MSSSRADEGGAAAGGGGIGGGDAGTATGMLEGWDMRRDDLAVPDDFTLLYTPEWSTHDAFERLPPERLGPLTHQAQRMLIAHQFPTTCAGKKYFVSSGNEELAGLGSHIHIATVHMSIAFEQDRIFLWEPWAGYIYTDPETCGSAGGIGSGGGGFDCFLRAPSNCTVEDAERPGVDTIRFGTGGIGVQWGIYPHHVPRPFMLLWLQTGQLGGKQEMKYWWRGQVAAYLTRFNPRALEYLRALRLKTDVYMRNHTALQGNETWLTTTAAMVPLPRGTISIHIRHGDKKKEMALVPTQRYVDAAEELVMMAPFGYTRTAFMSTEDPESIWVIGNSTDTRWRYLWWDVPRLNSNGPEQLGLFEMRRGELTMVWWLQLFIALEADAWVGTRGSNWNRLIDELRCVWLPKCQNVFMEVGDAASWEGYSW